MLPGGDLVQQTTSNGHSRHVQVNCSSAVNPGSATVQTPEHLSMETARLGAPAPVRSGAIQNRKGASLGHTAPGFKPGIILRPGYDCLMGISERVVTVDDPQGSAADSATVQITVESECRNKAVKEGGQTQLPGVKTGAPAEKLGGKRKAGAVIEGELPEKAVSEVSPSGEDESLTLGEHLQRWRNHSDRGVGSDSTKPSKKDGKSALGAVQPAGVPGQEQPLVTDQMDKEPRSADGSFVAASGGVKRPSSEVGHM